MVAVALEPDMVPFMGGILWFNLASIVLVVPVVISPGGTAQVPLPIPTTPDFSGLAVFAQAGVLDLSAVGGLALSRGLRVEIEH